MEDRTLKLTRAVGWILLIAAGLVLLGFVVFGFLTDPTATLFWKVVIGAFYLGLAALFVSVLRQRLIERKTDRYKDVEI